MKKILNIIFIFCLLSISVYAQKTPEFYFQKTYKEVVLEFEKDSSFEIKNTNNCIDVYCTNSNWAMKFFYNEKDSVFLIVFATTDHEIAQLYFDQNDTSYPKHETVEDFIQWSNSKNIVTFKFQNQSPYPYQFTYSIYGKN